MPHRFSLEGFCVNCLKITLLAIRLQKKTLCDYLFCMNIVLFSKDECGKTLLAFDDRAKHILQILKKREGETFDAGILGECAGTAKIQKIYADGSIDFSFLPNNDFQKSLGNPLFPIELFLGFPRPIQLNRILRDASSFGVQKITLFATDLGEKSYLKSNFLVDGGAQKSLLQGALQAESIFVPELVLEKSLKSALKNSCKNSQDLLKIVLDCDDKNLGLGNFLRKNEKPQKIILAIGNERGWSQNERQFFLDFGFFFCSMGRRILRVETAVCAALALTEDFLGVFGKI